MADTYTEEQVQAMIAEATGPLESQLAELRTKVEAGEQDEAITAATTPLNARIAELENEKDSLTAQLNTVTEERDSLRAAEEARETAEREKAEAEERKEARIAEISEVAKFTDEQIAERADRWAAMTDEAWASHLDGLREAAALAPATTETVRRTPLTAADHGDSPKSSVTGAMRIRRERGVHPRHI